MARSTVTTPVSPEDAAAQIASLVASRGATVTTVSPQVVTGSVVWKKRPSIIIAVILLILMILPGVLYLILAGKTMTEPFSVIITPNGSGSTLVASGTGRGDEAARYAIGKVR